MIEYKVRPVTRYVITRYEEGDNCAGSDTKGEFDNPNTAYDVAYALCRAEHEAAGTPPGDMNFIYPERVDDGSAMKGSLAGTMQGAIVGSGSMKAAKA